jgi:hypothetical protein
VAGNSVNVVRASRVNVFANENMMVRPFKTNGARARSVPSASARENRVFNATRDSCPPA